MRIHRILSALEFLPPPHATQEEIRSMAREVKPMWLKNAPVPIDSEAVETLYRRILQA